jgi:hypothetical protein
MHAKNLGLHSTRPHLRQYIFLVLLISKMMLEMYIVSSTVSNRSSPDVFIRPVLLVHEHIVEFVERFESLGDLPEHCVLAVQVVNVVTQRQEKLDKQKKRGRMRGRNRSEG